MRHSPRRTWYGEWGRMMRRGSRIIVFFLITAAAPVFAGNQIYRYKDDSGTLTFTTEWYSIPEKYRGEAVALEPEALARPQRQEPAVRTLTPPPHHPTAGPGTKKDGH